MGGKNPPTLGNAVGILRDFDIHRIMQTRVNLNMGDNRQETLLNYRFRFRFRPISFRSPIGEKKEWKFAFLSSILIFAQPPFRCIIARLPGINSDESLLPRALIFRFDPSPGPSNLSEFYYNVRWKVWE